MESRHITAVKKPWRWSNRYNALSQMLLTNQWLDKLSALRSELAVHGLVTPNHPPPLDPFDLDEENVGAVDDQVLTEVKLASTKGKITSVTTMIHYLSLLLSQSMLIPKASNISQPIQTTPICQSSHADSFMINCVVVTNLFLMTFMWMNVQRSCPACMFIIQQSHHSMHRVIFRE